MPSVGMPRSKMAGSHWGAPGSYTLAGPPEKIKPRGRSSATRAADRSWRTIWQKTFCSRTRRAISWPYWAPKSKIKMRSFSGNGIMLLDGILGWCFFIGTKGEQLLQDCFVMNLAVAPITFDLHFVVEHELDLPVFSRGLSDDHDGIVAGMLHRVGDSRFVQAL